MQPLSRVRHYFFAMPRSDLVLVGIVRLDVSSPLVWVAQSLEWLPVVIITLLFARVLALLKINGVWGASSVFADNLTELVITFASYEIDLKFVSAASERCVIMAMWDEMYTVYASVYVHDVCSIRLFRKGTTGKDINDVEIVCQQLFDK
jgi:hypothetical protein